MNATAAHVSRTVTTKGKVVEFFREREAEQLEVSTTAHIESYELEKRKTLSNKLIYR